MKTIYIYIPRKSPSCIMKTNIFNLLNTNIKTIIINKLVLDKNSLYYILKYITPEDVEIIAKLRELNNYLIYEPLDRNSNENNLQTYLDNIKKNLILFHHIICNNYYITNKYKEICPNLEYSVIYHEYDMRFKIDKIIPYNKIYYIGNIIKSSLTDEICKEFNIKIINPSDSEKFITNNYTGIHIDYIKNDTTYYYLHTSTKLSTAMCFNSIFICNKVPVYLELLGENYDFYINDDLSNLKDIINKAKNIITDNNKYKLYLENVKLIKQKLSYKYVMNDYINVFTRYIKE